MGTLEHNLTIEGLVKGGDTMFINLLIEADSTRTENIVRSCTLDMLNLISFQGRYRKIEICKEIGCRYLQFGIKLLKDDRGNFIESIIEEYQRNAENINQKILFLWVNGRGKPVSWNSLTEVLRDVGLGTLADEIEE